MKSFLDKVLDFVKPKEKIDPDGKYIVCDIRHESYSPERILYTRDYLKKFDPEIIEIENDNKLVISIDNDHVLDKLSDYLFEENENSSAIIISDKSIDDRVSGYVFIS